MGFQEVVLWNLAIKRGHQTREAFRANHRVNLYVRARFWLRVGVTTDRLKLIQV